MPEGLEAELYRRGAERALDRPVASIDVDARQPMAVEIRRLFVGSSFTSARRAGKLVVLDSSVGPTLGLHFGMTGRLVVDGVASIDELEYSSRRDDPAWDRLSVTFDDGGVLRVNDPRRWARFTVDPDLRRLGPDFLVVDASHLERAFARRGTAVKSALLDQSLVAGYGNLCVDEVLWQVGIDPTTPARAVPRGAIDRLVALAGPHLRAMLRRGGSHRGVISPEVRATLPPCPRDGGELRREQVGGRTTIWCPEHQTNSWPTSP